MAKKRVVLFVLLAVGILAVGGGVGLLGQVKTSENIRLSIPEGNPIIFEKLDYVMRGEFNYLYIYGDGSLVYIEEKGLRRLPSPVHPPTRTWKTGKLTPEEIGNLLAYLENSGLDRLTEPYYQFAGKPIEGGPAGGFTMGDMGFNITVGFGNLSKKVTAYGYLSPDKGETYPDMPSPLNNIYVKLRAIALETTEVAKENIASALQIGF